jgi:hypothetical protein
VLLIKCVRLELPAVCTADRLYLLYICIVNKWKWRQSRSCLEHVRVGIWSAPFCCSFGAVSAAAPNKKAPDLFALFRSSDEVCYPFATASRTALGPTQLPIQRIPGALPLRVKRPGREFDNWSPTSAEVKEWVGLYTHFPIRLHVVVLS